MNIPNFKDQPEFAESATAADKCTKVDTLDPTKMAVGSEASLAAIVQSFIATQSQTNHQLIQYIGKAVATGAADVTIDNRTLDSDNQQQFLAEMASQQNLLARQLEKNLHGQIALQSGAHPQADLHLINAPPTEWGISEKVSDSSIKLISEFSGDSSDNEQELSLFLRGIFALSKTSDLSEKTAVNVLFRKLTGSAYILTDQFLANAGPDVKMANIIRLLESKFLAHCSPLSAESALHGLSQGSLTYVQLQAKCTKLAFLATRMEGPATRETVKKLKETNAFLMAISTADRVVIRNENERRATHNLPQLSLSQMADTLQTLASEKASYARDPVLLAQEPVNNVMPRDQPRDNRPKNLRNPRNAQGEGQGRQDRGGRKLVTAKDVNVGDNACLLCGSFNHTFKQPACPYYGTPLMRSPCKNCSKGGHKHAICKSKPKTRRI